MPSIPKWLPALMMSLLCMLSAADAAQSPADTLLTLSGMTKQVEDIPDTVKMGFLQGIEQEGGMPDDLIEAIMKSADEKLSAAVILDDIRARVDKTVSKEEIRALLYWYESDTGRKITAAEEYASSPEGINDMARNIDRLLSDDKRVKEAKRMDELLGTTDRLLAMQENIMLATVASLSSVMLPDEPFDIEAFKSQQAQMEPQMRANVHAYVIVSFVYAYQSLSDSELARYENFLVTPAAKKFNDAAFEGMNSGLEKIMSAWSKALWILLKELQDEEDETPQETKI